MPVLEDLNLAKCSAARSSWIFGVCTEWKQTVLHHGAG